MLPNDDTVNARVGCQALLIENVEIFPHIDLLNIPAGVHSKNRTNLLFKTGSYSSLVILKIGFCLHGTVLLAKAVVITEHSVTTHWEDLNDLMIMFPRLNALLH